MTGAALLEQCLEKSAVSGIVDFTKGQDSLAELDLTANNATLTEEILADTRRFSTWIDQQIAAKGGRYGIGGYAEHRVIYKRSKHFDSGDEPRILHLGTDIWASEGTTIYSPLKATIHSFNYNDAFGDYGGTIILQHQIQSLEFYTLYGHLSLGSLENLVKGGKISQGEKLGSLGNVIENGNWPPHLHFQLILNMEGKEGDYPGVCKLSEKSKYLENCPDPRIILKYTFY